MNCRSDNNKTNAISDFIISNNINVCAITEIWLFNQTSPAILNKLISDGFKFLNYPQIRKKSGGLGIIYRKNLDVKTFDSKELKSELFYFFQKQNIFFGLKWCPPPLNTNGFLTSSFFKKGRLHQSRSVLKARYFIDW